MPASATRPGFALEVFELGSVDYREGLRIQERAVHELGDQPGHGTLFLLEHPPVVTLGRNASESNLRFPRTELERRGVEVHETTRGGDVTFHGPGQLVGYPVLHLPEGRRGVHAYVRDLEQVLILVLADFGLTGSRDPGYPGVWVGGAKIAALGVRIARWVTSHGFALNVDPDLVFFELITPCGLVGRRVTSMARELGKPPDMAAVKAAVARHFHEQFAAGESA